jgi:probable rRNA maturation factor
MAGLFILFRKFGENVEADYYMKTVIRRAIFATLDHEGFPYDVEVSVTLCDNEYIHSLNREHRGVDRHTDVLSFPMYEADEFTDEICAGGVMLGDIVLSLERAREQAEELGHGFLRECAFLVVHSTLHLLGYDHERSKEDDELQCRLQREIIEKVEI